MSPPALALGQVLRGRLNSYVLSKKVKDGIWFAKNHANELVVVKSNSGQSRVEKERDVLGRFRSRSPFVRPLIDEIQDPPEPTAIVLRHLESDLLAALVQSRLNRKEVKYISRRVLESLDVLHQDGYVHTDVKPSNILVNYREDQGVIRFSDVQLGDFGDCCHQDSEWAKSGTQVGAPIWSSPEVLMETPWTTATDIWSFGTLLISLIYGGDFNIFRPKTSRYGDEDYAVEIVKQQFRYFDPFPFKIREVVSEETLTSILYLMHMIPPEKMTPFSMVTDREVGQEDKEFILKIMQMDWRDRPTARTLLQDEWFREE